MKSVELSFTKGSILTSVMLDELRDFPREMLNLWYKDYPDGILSGMDVYREGNPDGGGDVMLSGGVIKYRNRIYRMNEAISLTARLREQLDSGTVSSQKRYQFVFTEKPGYDIDSRPSQVGYSLELSIKGEDERAEGIHLARFKCGIGSRDNDGRLIVLEKPGRWDMTECPYSVRGALTFHPHMFKEVIGIIREKERRSELDYFILNQLYNEGVLHIQLIEDLTAGERQTEGAAGKLPDLTDLPAGRLRDRAGLWADFLKFIKRIEEPPANPVIEKSNPPARRREDVGQMI